MTFIYELDLYSREIYRMCENELPTSSLFCDTMTQKESITKAQSAVQCIAKKIQILQLLRVLRRCAVHIFLLRTSRLLFAILAPTYFHFDTSK